MPSRLAGACSVAGLAPICSAQRMATRKLTSTANNSIRSCMLRSSTAPNVSAPPKLDLCSLQHAFASASILELVRGVLVLTVCSHPPIVRHADSLLGWSAAVFGSRVTEAVIRHTFFQHFCAGEDASSIIPTLRRLRAHGVGGILDYATEASIDESSPALAGINQYTRAYPRGSEALYDENKDTFLQAVHAVRNTSPDGFAAVKVSALGNQALLERVSTSIIRQQEFFNGFELSESGQLTKQAFIKGWQSAFNADVAESANEFDRLFGRNDVLRDRGVDAIDFTSCLLVEKMGPLVLSCRKEGPRIQKDHCAKCLALSQSALSAEECKAFRTMMMRLDEIASLARSLHVRVMIDAELSYLQPAIEYATLNLQRKHNLEYPAVFSTHQAYLVDSERKLSLEMERAKREGWHIGVKLVRGAYMHHERARAMRVGYTDPIHSTAEATHSSYNAAIDAILLNSPCPERTSLMVATHNEASVEHAAQLLLCDENGRRASTVPLHNVYFGQLLGMADHVTYNLASQGLKAYKYVPYGPVAEVMPYLLRRAQENADSLSNAPLQRSMMLRELVRRAMASA